MAFLRSIYTQECLDAADHKPMPRAVGLRVFKSDFIEKVLGRSHWVLPGVWFLPLVGYGIYRYVSSGRSLLLGAVLFAVAWVSFSLVEYVLHRWVFHYDFADTPDGRLNAFLVHGYHHDYPNDRLRLVAPPLMSWPLGVVLFAFVWLISPPNVAWLLFAGICCGYLAYDWLHYYSHHGRPRGGPLKWLVQYHMLHHHDGYAGRFGISSPLWDLLFGTYAGLDKRRPIRKARPAAQADVSDATPAE